MNGIDPARLHRPGKPRERVELVIATSYDDLINQINEKLTDMRWDVDQVETHNGFYTALMSYSSS